MDQKVFFPDEPDAFFETVKARVNGYFEGTGKRKQANLFFYLKAALLIGAYLGAYFVLISTTHVTLAVVAMILMGPLAILSGINIAHDGAHGAISTSSWINRLFQTLFDLLGANSYMWTQRHVFSHHLFPNVLNKDADLKQNPLVRIFPSDEIKKAHTYQFIYAPFLYLLYTINWLFFRDYSDFFKKNIGSLTLEKHARKEIVKLLCFKFFYITYILILPICFSTLSISQVFLGFVLMNFAASLLITLALIPSHVAETSLFLLPDETGRMPHSWSHHQVLSVIDFATDNWFLNFFFGGFNHHVAHHLFPTICHVHSVHVTRIIKQTTAEFGIPYHYEPSFLNAYISHFKLLKNNGRVPKEVVA